MTKNKCNIDVFFHVAARTSKKQWKAESVHSSVVCGRQCAKESDGLWDKAHAQSDRSGFDAVMPFARWEQCEESV